MTVWLMCMGGDGTVYRWLRDCMGGDVTVYRWLHDCVGGDVTMVDGVTVYGGDITVLVVR